MAVSAPKQAAADPQRWLEEHGDYLYAYALRRLGNAHDAEELVQEALLAGLQGLERYEGRSSERTWLTGILRHKIMQMKRKKAPESIDTQGTVEGIVEGQFNRWRKWKRVPARWQGDPQSLLEDADFKTTLTGCLEKMPGRLAAVLELVESRDNPADRVSEMLQTSTSNVYVMLYRARSLLRVCLERHWFGPPRRRERST
jgi:RNA polymerase sigma-70 factor, ECF subfamily